MRTLSRPLDADLLANELRRYDPSDAADVSKLVRANCELGPAVDRIVAPYERTIAEAKRSPAPPAIDCDRAVTRYLEQSASQYKSSALVEDRQRWIDRCLKAERALEDR